METNSNKKDQQKHILITEDDPAILDVLQVLLRRRGYTVSLYTNGSEIIMDNFVIPDLFLIDKQLSGADGLDICRHLKARPDTRHIPVIIISASPYVQKPAMVAGADDFIEKPFSNQFVADRIEYHLVSPKTY